MRLKRPSPRVVVRSLCLASVLWLAAPAMAAPVRPSEPMSAAEIRQALQELRVTGSVLYVAAHPDDENTALLATLARARKVRTAYLSLTRGDGGQNLVGQELGAELGVLRTQELLAARRLDGAEQFFTRAVDFGFSKNPDETFAIWGRDSILSDVVRVIRRFQPDVILTRFPIDGSGGHGHHTASAILAEEAFAAAADAKRFPECGPAWQAKRLMWNAWTPDGARLDSTWLRMDVGGYNALLGRTYGEIAAVSRSNHKSQGFGVAERHGALPAFLAPRLGESARGDLFDGVDLTWNRFPGGAGVAALLERAEREFDPEHPQASLGVLFEARRALGLMSFASPALASRRARLDDVIRSCTGAWVEAVALRPSVTPGETLTVVVTVVDRLKTSLTLLGASLGKERHEASRTVAPLGSVSDTLRVVLAGTTPLTQPYWLERPGTGGRFAVSDARVIGSPEGDGALAVDVLLGVGAERLPLRLNVSHRWADPVQGERWRALEIAPPATLAFDHGVYLFPDLQPRDVTIAVRAERANLRTRLRLQLPAQWRCEPASAAVALERRGEESRVTFRVTPAAGPASGEIAALAEVDGREWSHRRVVLDHPHVPMQVLFPPASARLVRTDVRHLGSRVGYLAGSGDAIPDALHQLGYEITALSDDDVAATDLSRFDAIVTGVRAYNTRPRLRVLQPRLLEYVNAGGTLLVQYNTSSEELPAALGPYPFTISRDRVTTEAAEVRVLAPGHPVLSSPNRIGPADFEGWVQERGLQFANPYDPRYTALLGSNDPGEPSRDGGLLVAASGRGMFEYCGYALFRQLPAGVPGAWRLFANLLAARQGAIAP